MVNETGVIASFVVCAVSFGIQALAAAGFSIARLCAGNLDMGWKLGVLALLLCFLSLFYLWLLPQARRNYEGK